MKNRIELAEYFAELSFTKGAEIGVYDGRYSEILCQTIPNLELLAVDSYSGRHKITIDTARARLEPFKATLVTKSSMEVVKDIPDESLDFVFIDADHTYEYVRDDIREWSNKVRPGGIVSGHDYYVTRLGNRGVVDAVDEYVKERGYELKLTDWARNVAKDDRQPSWYFFKEAVA